MTFNLILWRHAEAEEAKAQGRDLPRKLTRKGHKQAKKAAAYLRAKLPADARVFASQATRSQQTADSLGTAYHIMPALNPDIDARSLARILNNLRGHSHVVLVGHQPWLGQLCAFLLNGNWAQQNIWSVKKGAFWWFQVRPEADGSFRAKLKLVMSPADLAD
ncbi:SixA phosphatase family protein [Conchiformibius kuhniae]|uniref:Histidine phosphatase family protein n=1 Tax=Conchiformibius kuhniae TaxID=211502 RepID=A0A8T9MWB1_9NEIS|nr:histidine phosphatase family protein [Conchiformibius kuhniae]UOP05434.1 histidine phosphatase family protein [Conchiformibius kuhniae]